jgi:hypothetical protein
LQVSIFPKVILIRVILKIQSIIRVIVVLLTAYIEILAYTMRLRFLSILNLVVLFLRKYNSGGITSDISLRVYLLKVRIATAFNLDQIVLGFTMRREQISFYRRQNSSAFKHKILLPSQVISTTVVRNWILEDHSHLIIRVYEGFR